MCMQRKVAFSNFLNCSKGHAMNLEEINEKMITIPITELDITYTIRCDTDCELYFQSADGKFKLSFDLIEDNEEHTFPVDLPKTGNYKVYIRNEHRDIVKYEVIIKNRI